MTNKKLPRGVVSDYCHNPNARSVENSRKKKIKDFNLFIIRNHLSLDLLLSLYSLSQVKPTHVLFPLPRYKERR